MLTAEEKYQRRLQQARAAQARHRAKRHLERYGPGVGDQRGKADLGTIACEVCKTVVTKKARTQRRCKECSRRRYVLPPAATNGPVSRIAIKGRALNETVRSSIAWDWRDINLLWYVRFALPYDVAGSKNYLHGRAASEPSKVFVQKRARGYRELIGWHAKVAARGIRIVQNKLYIDIFVQMPAHRGDAVNFVDTVCDGLKVALGLDDKWFCIRRVDWEVCKTDPRIFIGFGQEEAEDVVICQSCGRLLPLEAFPKNWRGKFGVNKQCKECLIVAPFVPEPPEEFELASNDA